MISFLKISDIDPKTDIVAGDVNIVSFSRAIERFEPAICRFIENKAVIVIIPESRSRTFKRTWINPVTNPARAPTRKDIKRARYGFTPFTRETAVYGEIGKIQYFICNIYAEGEKSVYKALS